LSLAAANISKKLCNNRKLSAFDMSLSPKIKNYLASVKKVEDVLAVVEKLSKRSEAKGM